MKSQLHTKMVTNLSEPGGVGGTNDSRHGESVLARASYASNSVAEHLGASSRRPRHPFSALMAGATSGRVPVYTAQKRDPIKPRTAPVEQHNRDIDHLCSSTTATIALRLELEVVVVVGANNVVAAEPAIQHAKTPNVLLVLEIIDDVFSSHRPHAVRNRIVKLSGVKPPPPHDIATQTPPQQGNLPRKSTKSRQLQWQRWSNHSKGL